MPLFCFKREAEWQDKGIQKTSYRAEDNALTSALWAQSGSTAAPVHEQPSLERVPRSFGDEDLAAAPMCLLMELRRRRRRRRPVGRLSPGDWGGRCIPTVFHPLLFYLAIFHIKKSHVAVSFLATCNSMHFFCLEVRTKLYKLDL